MRGGVYMLRAVTGLGSSMMVLSNRLSRYWSQMGTTQAFARRVPKKVALSPSKHEQVLQGRRLPDFLHFLKVVCILGFLRDSLGIPKESSGFFRDALGSPQDP